MSVRSLIMPDTYRDSVFLMKLSSEAREESGAVQISAMMGTGRNKDLFKTSGLSTPEVEAARPGDLVIAIEADEGDIENALNVVTRMLTQTVKPKVHGEAAKPATLEQGLDYDPDLNMAIISVAGDYARFEAAKALEAGMDVMLYSDNISLDDEIALKRLASSKGLLVMGPDCGTAIVAGVPLAFANRVHTGPVGIVGASGTGLQELFCLLDRCGVGITNAYGTGGRDLKDDVGGITALGALDRLIADPNTKFLALIGKPPGKAVRVRVAEKVKASGKPAFVHYLGATDYAVEEAAGMISAPDTTALAIAVAHKVRPDLDVKSLFPETPLPQNLKPGCLRGLFGGGTLCQEAAELAAPLLNGDKYINMKVAGYTTITASDPSRGHTFWDLGDDVFTVGRPHPMMAPELRMDRLVAELHDPTVSVVLLDVVIGYGSHPDPAGEVVRAVQRAACKDKLIVASVTGTALDRPDRAEQTRKLEQAGIIVLPSNASAAVWAARAATGVCHA